MADRDRDRAREWAAYRAGRREGVRTGVVAGAVHNELRREARRRYYRGIAIYRPHGHWYPGFGYYRDDGSAWKWLAFTAITLKVLDNLNSRPSGDTKTHRSGPRRLELGSHKTGMTATLAAA